MAVTAVLFITTPVVAETAKTVETAIKSELETFDVNIVAKGLIIPWSMTMLPDGSALVGEREVGLLKRLNLDSGEITPIEGLPDMFMSQELSSGLFDVSLHPDYSNNQQLYIVYGVGTDKANGLAVSHYTLKGNSLVDGKRIFETSPRISGKWHFGGRLEVTDKYLFLSTAEGFERPELAQDLSAHSGKILRLNLDGSAPHDNPFVGVKNAKPEIWSYGLRNPQGMAIHPQTGELWLNEHGPQGGDEVNIARAGKNYGWPVISYGEQYGGGPIGEGITRKAHMEQPLYYWLPSIAPSGMLFYTGDAFPKWKNSIFNGALALTHLNRLEYDGERILHEERLLTDQN